MRILDIYIYGKEIREPLVFFQNFQSGCVYDFKNIFEEGNQQQSGSDGKVSSSSNQQQSGSGGKVLSSSN